jgi:predicted kinase
MELVLFIGIPASGKSTFYRQRFFRTHVRINRDMLKTKHREELLVQACIEGKTRFVVENTNLTAEERARFIAPARSAGFKVAGYYFDAVVSDVIRWNDARPKEDRVPKVAIFAAKKRLQKPTPAEGFDELFVVRNIGLDQFTAEPWRPEPTTENLFPPTP